MTKGKEGKGSRGRDTKYKKEYAEQTRKLCLLGLTDVEIADFFGVCEKTINNWKKKHSDFLQSITHGKMLADAEVAEKLRERALGYSHEAVKVFNTPNGTIEHKYTEHYPPDTQAAAIWLYNRQPSKWKRQPVVENKPDQDIPEEYVLNTDEDTPDAPIL